jgi:outer membrane protein OmpA-like peptidoglycan-associated protein
MKLTKSMGRPLLLIALFLYGALLIWHIGHNLFPRGDHRTPQIVAVPAARELKPAEKPDRPATPTRFAAPAADRLRLVSTARGRFIPSDPILFNSGASTLREASIPKLDKIAGFLMEHPEISVEIIGHTDNLNSEPVNQKVSAERAAVVMEYLASQGIDLSRLTSKGMGSLDPIESNDTQLGRQANRRIEFLALGQAGGSR